MSTRCFCEALGGDTMKFAFDFSKNKRRLIVALVAVVAAASAFWAYKVFWTDSSTAGEYLTGKVTKGDIKNTVSATGTLQAVTTVQVGSQVSGNISELYADFNSQVKKGQIVAQLDPSSLKAQETRELANVEQAKAGLADAQAKVLMARSSVENSKAGVTSAEGNLAALKAQRDDAMSILKRQEELAKSGIVPERDLETARTAYRAADARYNQAAAQVEQAKVSERQLASSGLAQAEAGMKTAQAQVQQAEANLRLVRVNLGYTTIRSPIDGVVVSRNVDRGQTVAASLSAPVIFTIANDLTEMQVIANIDQADIGVISENTSVTFTVDAFTGLNFKGKIRQIRLNPQTVQNVVTYNVVIDVANPDLKLKPGMTANLTMTVAERSGALRVPNAALRFRPQNVEGGGFGRRGGAGGGSPQGSPGAASPGQGGQQPQAQQGGGQGPGARGQGGPGGPGGAGGPGGPGGPGGAGGEGGGDGQRRFGGITPSTAAVVEGQTRIVWLMGADGKPQPKRIKIGITDGSNTEIVEGDLKEGDTVIIGQSVSSSSATRQGQTPPGFGGPRFGPGGGGPGGGGGGGGPRR